jgi:hypothetical protein
MWGRGLAFLIPHLKENKMTVQEALRNIDIVVANVQMKRAEHTALMECIGMIVKRCGVADKLESAAQGVKNGTTDKPT